MTTSYLITGGTGSLGRALVRLLLSDTAVQRVAVLSRDEYKQVRMRRANTDQRLRMFLGDVRDVDRLLMAFRGVQCVIHCAALKNLEATEKDPLETMATNVDGTANVIEAAIHAGVQNVLTVSSDKAVDPVSLYGATKLCAERLTIAANAYSGAAGCRFSVIRFGNFVGSRGSVIPLWRSLEADEPVPVTDLRMTRYWLTLRKAAVACLEAATVMSGGEVFVPRTMVKRKVVDVARKLLPGRPIREVGCRAGERLHESLMTEAEEGRAIVCNGFWVCTEGTKQRS